MTSFQRFMRKSKTLRWVGALSAFLALQILYNNSASLPSQAQAHVKGQILLQPKSGVSQKSLDRLLAGHNAKSLGKMEGLEVHIVSVPDGAEEAIANALAHNPMIKFAEMDQIIKPTLVTSDPYLSSEWYLNKVGAYQAWDSVPMQNQVIVAHCDSGVESSHPDLKANLILPGYNSADGSTNSEPVMYHGTHTAGIWGAVANNGIGVAGVAPIVRMIPIRITNSSDGSATFSAMASCIRYAADHGARVANLSYLAGNSSAVDSAAQYLASKGGLLFVAAGNNSTDISSWPNFSSFVLVGATDGSDVKSYYSNYGTPVDLTAPGDGMYSTSVGQTYSGGSGTSDASPVAAGVAALVYAVNPKLSSLQVQNILFNSALDLGAPGKDPLYGYGRVRALEAVQLALQTPAPSDTQPPTVSIAGPSAGTVVNGILSVNVNASDNVGVARVELYAAGRLFATDTTSPYAFSLDTTAFPEGSLSLMAKAYDAAGNVASSSTITVTVDNVPNPIDTQAPVVHISSPVNGITVRGSGSISISASATDNVGVVLMTVSVDGKITNTASNVGSISASFNAKKASTGAHVIRVDAKDAAGNIGSSSVQFYK